MKGEQFKRLMKDCGYTQVALAAKWGIARQTVAAVCKSDEVNPLYADAIRAIAFRNGVQRLAENLNGIMDNQ